MRIAILVMLVGVPAFADDDPPSNSVTLQVGLLPGHTVMGSEYTRQLGAHLELGETTSFGRPWFTTTSNLVMVPRLRLARGTLRFALGLGVGLMDVDDGDLHYTTAELVADAVLTAALGPHLLLQLRGGLFGYIDQGPMGRAIAEPYGASGIGVRF